MVLTNQKSTEFSAMEISAVSLSVPLNTAATSPMWLLSP